jgi:hypothetical protein
MILAGYSFRRIYNRGHDVVKMQDTRWNGANLRYCGYLCPSSLSEFRSDFSFSGNPVRDDGVKPMMKRNGIMGDNAKYMNPEGGEGSRFLS